MKNQVNKIILVGYVSRDPESRHSDVCKFCVATNTKWGKKETVTFHNCVAFGKTSQFAMEYIKKGDLVYLEGEQHHDKYESNGQTKYFSEIAIRELRIVSKKNNGEQSRSEPWPDDDVPF